MTKFLIGLLLGLILGVAGASAFLITAGGGDYFVGASPRVRELEASLREADQERQWLRGRLSEATETGNRLESRFVSLAARFEALGGTGVIPPANPAASTTVPSKTASGPAAAPQNQAVPNSLPSTQPTASPTPLPTDLSS